MAPLAVEAHHESPTIEIGTDDDVSYCGSSTLGSYTTSLSSSVFDFVYENGRRYTSNRSSGGIGSEYIIPNDEKEQERLDLAHHLWGLLLKGALHTARLDKALIERRHADGEPFRVLDLGTGTGIWAVDFGDLYPKAEVVGIDLSPIQPDWVPPNVRFEVDNFEDEWIFKYKFDYIHGRNLVGSVRDWPGLLAQIYKNLAPGGIVEFQESHATGPFSEDNTLTKDSLIQEYTRHLQEAGALLKQPMDAAPKVKSFLKDAGFQEIHEVSIKAPVGSWARDNAQKEIGLVFQAVMQTGVEAYGLAAFTRILGWDEKKAKALIDGAVEEFNNKKIHKIYPVFVVHGKKPVTQEDD